MIDILGLTIAWRMEKNIFLNPLMLKKIFYYSLWDTMMCMSPLQVTQPFIKVASMSQNCSRVFWKLWNNFPLFVMWCITPLSINQSLIWCAWEEEIIIHVHVGLLDVNVEPLVICANYGSLHLRGCGHSFAQCPLLP